MNRRTFIAGLGSAVAWPVVARGQRADRVRHIGALMTTAETDPEAQTRLAAFKQALQQLGWIADRNARIDTRWGRSDSASIRAQAAELVALAPDVILATGSFS